MLLLQALNNSSARVDKTHPLANFSCYYIIGTWNGINTVKAVPRTLEMHTNATTVILIDKNIM